MTRTAVVAGRIRLLVLTGFAALALTVAPGQAQGQSYSQTRADCTTNQNRTPTTDGGKNVWFIGMGCDSYQNEFYERPTAQSYEARTALAGGLPAAGAAVLGAKEYFENLDIKNARVGFDQTELFIGIEMVGLNKVTENGVGSLEGLTYEYGFILSKDANGAGGLWLLADGPALANGGSTEMPNTAFTNLKTFGHLDTDFDVGGAGISITKSDLASEVNYQGFDLSFISDGVIQEGPNDGLTAFLARVNPLNTNEVEFRLNYARVGFTFADIDNIVNGGGGYLDFRAIKGGPKDPKNFMWNDEYTLSEAGTPYSTRGLGNIYENDTLRFVSAPPPVVVPEPSAWAMLLIGFGALGSAIRRRRSVRLVA